jgi:Protein of unknown function (DUF3426).
MLISCPNCATNFSVPDKALGIAGRTLKCARCGHKWFQSAPRPEDDFALDESSFPPPPLPEPRPVFAPEPEAHAAPGPEPDLTRFDFGRPPPPAEPVDLDDPPIPDLRRQLKESGVLPPELDLDGEPKPIPEVFASPPRTRKGTGGLWLLLLALLLAAAGGGAYQFQDKVVGLWPPAHQILTDMGLRVERPGAGLELKNAGTPERLVQNDSEILIVRGIIANVSDRERPVPTMKLVLLDKDRVVVQEKLSQPPVTALDPGGTAGFRILLERPDPNAVEVNVLFVDPREAEK